MAGSDTELIAELVARLAERDGRIEALAVQVEQLTKLLEEARRAGKRQAAPFSKGDPKPDPKTPGRKAGKAYGKRSGRAVPDRADRELDAPLPPACPDCGGRIVGDGMHDQWVCELPKCEPVVTRFRVHVGRCAGCDRRVQGRHPEQASDALGAAGVQLGPRAKATAQFLHYQLGLSFDRCRDALARMFALTSSRAALCRAANVTATALAPTHAAIERVVNTSAAVTADETGWRVGGGRAWLWVVTCPKATLYKITPGRGFDDAKLLLEENYAGVLVRDGWAPYRAYSKATHQSCIAHLARRAHELRQELPAHLHGFPNAVSRILDEALAWRDAERPAAEQANAAVELHDRLLTICHDPINGKQNQTFARHLIREADAIFTFLTHGTDAANWRAEQAIRPAVVNRKTYGGNRTENGAQTQSVITTFLVTARQQGHNAIERLVDLARAPTPALAFPIH